MIRGVNEPLKRVLLYVFLLTFVYFGVEGKELWPMTGWRLFSSVRTDSQSSWQVDYIGVDGRSRPVPFDRMSWAYRGFPQVLRGFPDLPRDDQVGVCSAWLGALQALGIESDQLEIHRTTWRLSDREGPRAKPPRKVLAFTCTSHVVQER